MRRSRVLMEEHVLGRIFTDKFFIKWFDNFLAVVIRVDLDSCLNKDWFKKAI